MFISHVAHVGKSVFQLQAMSRAPDGAKKKNCTAAAVATVGLFFFHFSQRHATSRSFDQFCYDENGSSTLQVYPGSHANTFARTGRRPT